MPQHTWWQAAVTRAKTIAAPVAGGSVLGKIGALDAYVYAAPAAQNAVDLFAGQWASQLPPPLDRATGGFASLFDDPRLAAALQVIGGVQGLRILELGPLEAGHACMLDRAGAADILAIEGNSRAFLKCLVVKELVGIPQPVSCSVTSWNTSAAHRIAPTSSSHRVCSTT